MFFAMLGINLALIISGSMALIASEVVGGTVLLVCGFTGIGFMMWYYQGFVILADRSYSVHRSECSGNPGNSRSYNRRGSSSGGYNRRNRNSDYGGSNYGDSDYGDSDYGGGYSDGGSSSDSSGGSD